MPEELEAPGFTACYRYSEILDYERINRETGLDLRYSNQDVDVRRQQQVLSLGNILKYTPSPNESIALCKVRFTKSYVILEKYSNECLELFSVRKFFVLEYVCYQYNFKAAMNQLFLMEELTSSPAFPGRIFKIHPGKLFNRYRLSKFMVTNPNQYPYEAVKYTPVLDRYTEESDIPYVTLKRYTMTYYVLYVKRLPPPFETNCYNYSLMFPPTESQVDCHQMCVTNKTTKNLNRVPFSSIVVRPFNQPVMGYNDIENQTMVDLLHKYYEDCNAECGRKDCHEVRFFSRITFEPNNKISFRIMTPDQPWVYVVYYQLLNLAEYLSFSFSCIGIWFGISALELNPFKFYLERQRRNQFKNNQISQRIFRYSNQRMKYDINFIQSELKNIQKNLIKQQFNNCQHAYCSYRREQNL